MSWRWARRTESHPITGERSDWFVVTAPAEAGESFAEDVWRVLRDEVLPAHSPSAYDHVRLEVWADSGRTLLFPAATPFVERIDLAGVEVSWPSMHEAWEEAEGRDDITDEALERLVGEEVTRIVDVLEAGWRRLGGTGVPVECWEYGEERLRVLS